MLSMAPGCLLKKGMPLPPRLAIPSDSDFSFMTVQGSLSAVIFSRTLPNQPQRLSIDPFSLTLHTSHLYPQVDLGVNQGFAGCP